MATHKSQLPATVDYALLEAALDEPSNQQDLFATIVNAPFARQQVEMALLFLGIIVFLRVNKKTGTIERIALSSTEPAERTKRKSAKRFEDIKIPLGHTENVIVRAIQSGKPQGTNDWKYLFTPSLTPKEAHFNQADGGIAYSAVYPLRAGDGGALIFSYYQYPDKIGHDQKKFMEHYAAIVDTALSKTED